MKKLLGIAALAACSAPGNAAWYEVSSRHFVMIADQKPDDLKRYAERLERFDAAVRLMMGRSDPSLSEGQKLKVFVLPNVDAIERLKGYEGVAGFYQTRASGSAVFVPKQAKNTQSQGIDPEAVFYHEYLHHLMLQDLDRPYPAWLTEGAAEFYGATKIDDKKQTVTIGSTPIHRIYGLMVMLNELPLADMVGATYSELTAEQTENLYGRGWLLTHYLTFSKERAGQMDTYVRLIGSGKSASVAATTAFGDLKKLDRELKAYANGNKISGIQIRSTALPIGPVTVRQMTDGEAAIAPIVIRSTAGVTKKTAPGVAADARRIAAAHPDDPAVQTELAEAEYDFDNDSAALAAAERTLALRPNDVHAHIYRGRAMVGLATDKEAKGPKADWKTIRANFIKANKLNTENAEPLMLYYQSFLEEGVRPTKDAVDGLIYAMVLAPQDEELRFMAVQQLLTDRKLKEARAAMIPIAFDPHLGKKREAAAKVIEAIDRGKSDEALKALRDFGTA